MFRVLPPLRAVRSALPFVAGFLALAPSGCGAAPAKTYPDDVARKTAPIPACIVHMPPRKTAGGARVSLKEEAYWKLVYPEHDPADGHISQNAVACNGRTIMTDPSLEGGEPLRGGWPLKVEEGDVVFGAAADRIKLVWLRSHKYPDGSAGGTLAIVRVMDEHAEVYAVGPYRGRPDKSKLAIERMGGEMLLTALNDGCTGRPPNSPCETTLTIHLPRYGKLNPVANILLEKVAYATHTEPGIQGQLEYHLTGVPNFSPTGIKLLEQVAVRDDRGRPLRKTELERYYALISDGFQQSETSLWPRLYPKDAKDTEKKIEPVAPPTAGSATPKK